jgi:hypothetical protein
VRLAAKAQVIGHDRATERSGGHRRPTGVTAGGLRQVHPRDRPGDHQLLDLLDAFEES